MGIDTAPLEWPPDLLNDEEQDEPLAGQDHHLTIDNLHYPLYARLRGPDCFVASELRVHCNRRNLRDYLEPDVLVALGVPDRLRRRYLLWDEGKAPDLVIEILSPSSEENGDLDRKREWYRQVGVREYVVIDPSGEFAPEPRLQAWRFGDLAAADSGGAQHVLPDADGLLRSRVVPFGWQAQGDWVLLIDTTSGDALPTLWELEPRLRAETARREQAEEQARLAEARAHLLTERARLAAEQALAAAARAEAEAAARQELEAELERLRRRLEGQG